MQTKKLLALALALVLALGLLAGCGGAPAAGSDSGSQQPGGGQSQPSGGTDAAPVKKGVESIIVEVINFGYNDPDLQAVEDAINAISEEKIGVHVHFLTVGIGDMATKLGLMVAGNEPIDMVATGLLTSPAQLVSQGLLQPITQYIENSPILKEKAGDMLQAGMVNGELYAYPGHLYNGTGVALYYDKGLAEQYGIEMPERLEKQEDFEAIFQAVLDSGMPEYAVTLGDGVNQQQDFGVRFEDLGDHTNVSYGAILDPFNSTTVVNWYATPEYEAQSRLHQEWFQKGYTVPDSLSNGVTSADSLAAGQCFSFFAPYSTGQEEGYYTATCNRDMGAVHFSDIRCTTADVLQTSWGIPSTSTKAEAVIKFAELMYSDPAVGTLYRYGIEGQHYVKVEGTKGTITYPEGKDASNVGYGSFIPFWGDEAELPVLTPKDDSFYEVINSLSIENSKVSRFLGYSFDPSAVMSQVTAAQAVIGKYAPSISVGATDVDTMLPKFLDELKAAGIDDIIAENQRQVDEWCKTH